MLFLAKLRKSQSLLAMGVLCCAALTAKAQTLSPSTVSFGNWVIQTTSTVKTVTLTNTLTTPLTISSISASGEFWSNLEVSDYSKDVGSRSEL